MLVLVPLFIGCKNTKNQGGAICFTFDDDHIESWENYSDVFDKYNIKASFFITRPHKLSPQQIEGLLNLKSQGHEIGCHSLTHKNPLEYIHSPKLYFTEEVEPAIKILKSFGIDTIQSYAYPFGNALPANNILLTKQFTYLRKATWNKHQKNSLAFYDNIFASKTKHRIVNAMGIDYNYHIKLKSIKRGLKRAKRNNEVLILYAHKIDSSHQNYTVDPAYLEEIFKLCKEKNIKSIRFMDLDNYFKDKN